MSTTQRNYGDDRTRRRILQAAWWLLERRGSRLTLSAVATRARISRQSVYLHFGDRPGLLRALVEHVDASYGLDDLVAHVHAAPTGEEALSRLVAVLDEAGPVIDAVALMLESAQYEDAELGQAWRNRMKGRQSLAGSVMDQLAREGVLAAGWTVDSAADLCYTVTMPGPWRELTREMGWTRAEYVTRVTRLLSDTFLVPPRSRP